MAVWDMLIRHRIVLALLTKVPEPLTRTFFVKLVFLLRQETTLKNLPTFYDFVPYKYGPFSFALYRDTGLLRAHGYVTDGEVIALRKHSLSQTQRETEKLPGWMDSAVSDIVARYGAQSQGALVEEIYQRYPWFALNSELPARDLVSVQRPEKAKPAVYTAGYEGKSVDAFFNDLLLHGIDALIDVRANPSSRKYGFSKRGLDQLCTRLELKYHHMPSLGIPSSARVGLGSYASYQRLLSTYEESLLPQHSPDVEELGRLMRQTPSVLVCLEKDVRCCHRSKLARAVRNTTGLEIVHL